MARMYPPTLDEGASTQSEKRVFDRLRDGLSDEWDAFHSVGWVNRDPVEGAKVGEIDFVLVHQERGVVALEVKGSGVECRHGQWSRLRDGKREGIKDPFDQAVDHEKALERLIARLGEVPAPPFVVHALAFPHVTIHQLQLAPDAPREILLDRHDVEVDKVEASIDRVLAYHRGLRDRRRVPSASGASAIRDRIAPEIELRVPMADAFVDEEEALITLTRTQAGVLANLARNQRMAVYGCAGSGKTMLAVEHAKRLARDGKRVVFVCFNRGLRDHLAQSERKSGVTFTTFHALCTKLAKAAKVTVPSYDGEAPQEFWETELPDALVAACAELGPQFDALVVDEAQDLRDSWLEALLLTLEDPENGPAWLFLDDNQAIYGADRLTVPKEFLKFELDVNCRNTQAIHREVMKKYKGTIEPRALGPEGREVEAHFVDDQAATVMGVVQRLCGEEEILPQDVVILCSHAMEKSAVAAEWRGPWALTKERGKLGKYVQFSSIRAFKGLESPVVILCELEDIEDETLGQQIYVGMSRAKNHCVVVVPPAAG